METDTLFRATFRCLETGGLFDVWVKSPDEAASIAVKLKATLVETAPSSQAALNLAQIHVMLGLRPQLRFPPD